MGESKGGRLVAGEEWGGLLTKIVIGDIVALGVFVIIACSHVWNRLFVLSNFRRKLLSVLILLFSISLRWQYGSHLVLNPDTA